MDETVETVIVSLTVPSIYDLGSFIIGALLLLVVFSMHLRQIKHGRAISALEGRVGPVVTIHQFSSTSLDARIQEGLDAKTAQDIFIAADKPLAS